MRRVIHYCERYGCSGLRRCRAYCQGTIRGYIGDAYFTEKLEAVTCKSCLKLIGGKK